LYPALSKLTLFVEEEGHIYAALPGEDARRLGPEAAEIWYACNGVTSITDIVTSLAGKRQQPIKEVLEAVFNFLSHQSGIGFIEIYEAPLFEDVIGHRLDRLFERAGGQN